MSSNLEDNSRKSSELGRKETIHKSAAKGNLKELIDYLRENGYTTINSTDEFQQTPLHVACFRGHLEMVTWILQKCLVNVNMTDKNGWTALHCAALGGHLAVCEQLLLNRANACLVTNSQSSMLHYLAKAMYPSNEVKILERVVKLALKRGADINAQNNNGETPLHLACLCGDDKFIDILLKKKANVQITTRNQEDCIAYALKGQNHAIVEKLKKKKTLTMRTKKEKNLVREGSLTKVATNGEHVVGWFVLQDAKLYHYGSWTDWDQKKNPLSVLFFDSETYVMEDEEQVDESPKSAFSFTIYQHHLKSVQLGAKDKQDQLEWLQAIKGVCNMHSNKKRRSTLALTPIFVDRDFARLESSHSYTSLIENHSFLQRKSMALVLQKDKELTSDLLLYTNPADIEAKKMLRETKDVVLLCNISRVIVFDLAKILVDHNCLPRIAHRLDSFRPLNDIERKQLNLIGAEVKPIDFDDLGPLFDNVTKLVIFDDLGETTGVTEETLCLIAACFKANVQHIIKSSFIGCEKWHKDSENVIVKSKIPWTFIHHNNFMQNFLVEGIRESAVFSLPVDENAKVSWVDARDVSVAVEEVITSNSSEHLNKTYHFTGPEALSCTDIADILSQISRKTIKYFPVTEEDTQKEMEQMQIPSNIVMSHLELYREHNKGAKTKEITMDLENVIKGKSTSFKLFAQENIDCFVDQYLRYFQPDSEELMTLSTQFDKMREIKPKEDEADGNNFDVCRSQFVKVMGLIVGNNEEFAEALFNAFDKVRTERISFKEYAAGTGKITKGSKKERIEFAFRMYHTQGYIGENEFLDICNALSLFIRSIKIEEHKMEQLKEIFINICEHESGKKISFQEFFDHVFDNPKFYSLIGWEDQEKEFSDNNEQPVVRSKCVAISYGHENWDLVESMLTGIRKCILESLDSTLFDEPTSAEFEQVEELTISRDNTFVPFSHFAPKVFFKIREFSGITPSSFLVSLVPERILGSLEEVISTGKSKSFFFRTRDKRYLLKTIGKEEAVTLLRVLPDYYEHLKRNPESLLTNYYALYKFVFQKKEIYFVVMSNIFNTHLKIHEQYDLKGSTVGRIVEDAQPNTEMSLKDLNFNRKIYLGELREKFIHQIERDCEFLEKQNLCDYSLLVGFSFCSENPIPSGARQIHGTEWTKQQGGVLARSEKVNEVYFFGIVDILTRFDLLKKTEHRLKLLVYQNTFSPKGAEISSIPPNAYRERFIKYVSSIVEQRNQLQHIHYVHDWKKYVQEFFCLTR